MKIGWLVYNHVDAEKNKSYINWFIQEAKLQHISLKLILREALTIGIINDQRTVSINDNIVPPPDFAIIRTIEPLLNVHLESMGSKVFNSSEVSRIFNNKALTHHHMVELDIPMVDTLFYKKEDILNSPPPFSYPFVMKEIAGRGGKQVYFINELAKWRHCVQEISSDIIIQRTNVQPGKDLRVFVVGKEIIAAVLRENTTDFRANFTLGGSAQLYELNEKERLTIEKIINHFHFGMVGIDFLIGQDGGLLFNEIEDIVGSRTLSTLSDINIVRKYVTHIKQTFAHN